MVWVLKSSCKELLTLAIRVGRGNVRSETDGQAMRRKSTEIGHGASLRGKERAEVFEPRNEVNCVWR
jgi:hypothetical protein